MKHVLHMHNAVDLFLFHSFFFDSLRHISHVCFVNILHLNFDNISVFRKIVARFRININFNLFEGFNFA